jgi:anaerobic ribonucleoside-triphosphate reductase
MVEKGGMLAVQTRLDGFRKRDGLIVPFQREKITGAVRKASENVTRHGGVPTPADMPEQVTDRVLEQLGQPQSEYYVSPDHQGQRIAHLEDVQDLVEVVLAEMGQAAVVAAYKRYRKLRELARDHIRVRDANHGASKDVTDASLLLVESVSADETLPWDRARIIKQLTEKIRMPAALAASISKAVENQVIACGVRTVSTKLIRELVNNELEERGCHAELEDLSLYSVPRDYIDQLMFTKSVENSNIVNNNPEAVNLGIAELILKQWAMDTIFSPEVKHAHNTGAVHLHDLGYPHRVYCSSHSVEYVKKYGLMGLSNLNTESKPARSASVLTGHLNTFLASMQSNYAGALGLAYLNILYAPYLEGMNAKHLKQVAQELIFNGSQNAFSRGGQTLFLDFNIHSGVPSYLIDVPAVGPGGSYMLRRADGKKTALLEDRRQELTPGGWQLMDLYLMEDGQRRLVLREVVDAARGVVPDAEVAAALTERGERIVTYGDYTEIAQNFSRALLEVWEDGDKNGRVFEFPKCDFHISEETFSDPAQSAIFLRACEVASRNGSTYFIFDRDAVTLSACCRLRTTIQDNYLLRHPESLRFCGFQNVTINIPQCAYSAARKGRKDLGGLCEEIDRLLHLAVQAHLQKKAKIAEMLSEPGRPLWQIGKPACDGKPYVELDKCTYIIGLIGVNDAVQFLLGRQLHEDPAAMDMALKVVAHMFLRVREFTEQYGLKFSIEESPAESAARRLAKADLVFFPEEARGIVKGDSEDVAYYTNSIHLAPEAEVGLVERIRQQSQFHSLIESGAIIHAFVGEEQPSPESIARLVRETFFRTQSAQLTISPEFTYCNDCGHNMRGLHERCTQCHTANVEQETRVVGYFSKIKNWNKSKRYGELLARQRGRYRVETAENETKSSQPQIGNLQS